MELIISDDELKQYKQDDYKRRRKIAYDALNQNELRFDDLENNTNNWQLSINAIKAKYPKEVC